MMERPAPKGMYLTDIALLNEIYQAAKIVLFRLDNFTLAQLGQKISQAEGVHKGQEDR
jgi:hypothetical protein